MTRRAESLQTWHGSMQILASSQNNTSSRIPTDVNQKEFESTHCWGSSNWRMRAALITVARYGVRAWAYIGAHGLLSGLCQNQLDVNCDQEIYWTSNTAIENNMSHFAIYNLDHSRNLSWYTGGTKPDILRPPEPATYCLVSQFCQPGYWPQKANK
jgi:hypothetical protein